jgi:hypothetical protein
LNLGKKDSINKLEKKLKEDLKFATIPRVGSLVKMLQTNVILFPGEIVVAPFTDER